MDEKELERDWVSCGSCIVTCMAGKCKSAVALYTNEYIKLNGHGSQYRTVYTCALVIMLLALCA